MGRNTRYQRGESIFDGRMRYTKYYSNSNTHISEMLYDHNSDAAENRNVSDASDHQSAKDSLSRDLDEIISRLNWGEKFCRFFGLMKFLRHGSMYLKLLYFSWPAVRSVVS